MRRGGEPHQFSLILNGEMMKTDKLIKIVVRAALLAVVGMLADCSTYTVQQSKLFTDAGKEVAADITTADQANIAAENALRKNVVALNRAVKKDVHGDANFVDIGPESGLSSGGGQCSIEPGSTIYLRYVYSPEWPTAFFIYDASHAAVGDKMPYFSALKSSSLWSEVVAQSCAALRICEQNPFAAGCNTTCYTKNEIDCLNALGNFATSKGAENVLSDKGKLDSLKRNISAISYPLQAPLKSQIATDALLVVSQYLDLMQRAAIPKPTRLNTVVGDLGGDSSKSIADTATTLSTNLIKLRGKYNQGVSDVAKIGVVVATINGVSDANLTKELGAFAQLADTLNQIAQAAIEARNIADVIQEPVNSSGHPQKPGDGIKPRWQYVDDYISMIKEDLENEAGKTFSIQAIGNDRVRQVYGQAFKMAHTAQERSDALTALANSPTANAADYQALQAQINKQIPDLLDKMKKAHDDLVQLVIDPSASQKRAEMVAGFGQFKAVVQNIAAIAALYK
jgi:hypothetical protein